MWCDNTIPPPPGVVVLRMVFCSRHPGLVVVYVPSLSPERNTSTEVQPAEGSKPPAASPTALGSVPLTPTWW